MPNIDWNKAFARQLKKILARHPELEKKFRDKIELLEQNPCALSLRKHKLTGNMKSVMSITLTYDYRLLFTYDEETDTYILGDIGPHDDVY